MSENIELTAQELAENELLNGCNYICCYHASQWFA